MLRLLFSESYALIANYRWKILLSSCINKCIFLQFTYLSYVFSNVKYSAYLLLRETIHSHKSEFQHYDDTNRVIIDINQVIA